MTIQRTGWFICQKQFGIVDNCPGTRTTLLLAAGNLIGILVQNIRDIELLGNVLDTRLHISGGCFIDGKSQCNVFRNRQGIQQIKVLKHKAKILPAKPGNGLGLYLRNIRSSQIDVSCAHGVNRGNTVEQSRLSRAGSAHNAQKLTSFYRKANISDCFCDISLIAIVFLDMF